MALRITLGHCSSHTSWSYFRPATKYTTVLPATESAVALASSRSALNSSSVAFTRFGERLTCRMRSEYSGRRRDSSRPMTPLAPSTVCIRDSLRFSLRSFLRPAQTLRWFSRAKQPEERIGRSYVRRELAMADATPRPRYAVPATYRSDATNRGCPLSHAPALLATSAHKTSVQ